MSTDSTQTRPVNDATEEPEVHFVSFVLDDTQRTWTQMFQQQGRSYRHAKLVLFRDAIQSACGFAQAATGPFYCPGDQKVYIDLGFYDELQQKFGADAVFIDHEIQTAAHSKRVQGFKLHPSFDLRVETISLK